MNYKIINKITICVVSFFALIGFIVVFDNFAISHIGIDAKNTLSSVVSVNVKDSNKINDFEKNNYNGKTEELNNIENTIMLINSAGMFDKELDRIEHSLDVLENNSELIDFSPDFQKNEIIKSDIEHDKEKIKKDIREQSKDLLQIIKKENKYFDSNDIDDILINDSGLGTENNIENKDIIYSVENNNQDFPEKDIEYKKDTYFKDYSIGELEDEFADVFGDLFKIENKTNAEIVELEKIVIKNKKISERVEIQSISTLTILRDSDLDGISDYDEINIYETNPNSMDTDNDGYFDGVEIMIGFNPTDESNTAIEYDNPKESEVIANDDLLFVEEIKIISDCVGEDCVENKIEFSGKALPNSFITLYIFSIPTVVTVKTDSYGNWSYILDRELEDGKHEIYVAMTDGSGKIVAKNNPISFNKQASVITVNERLKSLAVENKPPSFFNDSFVYITLLSIFLSIGIMLIFSGGMRSRNEDTDNNNSFS